MLWSFHLWSSATQNPVEHEGTYRLPEAQLDRFMFKILVDYPRKEEEVEILELHDKRSSESWKEQTPVVSVGELSYLREKVHDVHVDEKIKAFIVDIVGYNPRQCLVVPGCLSPGIDRFDE